MPVRDRITVCSSWHYGPKIIVLNSPVTQRRTLLCARHDRATLVRPVVEHVPVEGDVAAPGVPAERKHIVVVKGHHDPDQCDRRHSLKDVPLEGDVVYCVRTTPQAKRITLAAANYAVS